LFPYAFTIVFSSYFLCIFSRNEENNPFYPDSFSTSSSLNNGTVSVLMYLNIVLLLLLFIFSFVIRLFVFRFYTYEFHIFSSNSGFYSTIQFVLIFIIIVLSPVLKNYPIVTSIVGSLFFLYLTFYPLFYQPYFNPSGNAISSAAFSVCFITFFFSIFLNLIKNSFVVFDNLPYDLKSADKLPIPVVGIVFAWIGYALLFVIVPLIMFKVPYRTSKKEWAMRTNEDIPVLMGNSSDSNINFQKDPNSPIVLSTNTLSLDPINPFTSPLSLEKKFLPDSNSLSLSPLIVSTSSFSFLFVFYFILR
jgi:hypothetical protein